MIKRANLGLMVAAIMVVLIGAGSAWADLTDGLAAHWKFDGDANDSAGSNDGTPVNGPVWTTGQINGALEFDGDDDYVDCGNDESLNFGTGDFSIAGWFKTSYTAGSQWLIEKLTQSAPWIGYRVIQYNNNIKFGTFGASAATETSFAASLITDGNWHHIAAVRENTGVFLWLDGTLTASDTGTVRDVDTTNDLVIGITHDKVSNPFNGTVDEVRIYDRALSASEVRQLYGGELLGLEITGPDTVAENFQAQYNAVAFYERADIDVTDSADWSVEPNDNCSIIGGLLTTEPIDLPEDITIYAEYTEDGNSVAAEKEVEVFAVCPSGSALEFDGINDYVEIADDDSLTPQSEITIAFWIYNRGGQSAGIFKYANCPGDPASPGESRAYLLFIDNDRDDKIQFSIFSTVDAVDYLFGNTTNISLNQWHHIVGTFNAGEAKVYLDGNLDNSKTMSVSSIMNDAHPLIIGGLWNYCGGQPTLDSRLNGNIDEITIYNRALSAEQIQLLTHTRPDGEPNLVGYWDFDEGEEQLAGDSSGNYNDGTLGSGPDVDSSDPEWVVSDAPVGICSLEGLVERNLWGALDMKESILDILQAAIAKEEAAKTILDESFKNGGFGTAKKKDVAKAKQKIRSAIRQEGQAETTVIQSINKLNDALDALGIDPTSWHQSEIEEEIIRADINADGVVDSRDFTILTEHRLKSHGP